MPDTAHKPQSANLIAETIVVAILLGLLTWSVPPDVNEAHYLTKAKHFWNPEYCPEDLFLGSHNSHWLFFAGFGWLPNLVSFEVSAWSGRIACWLLIGLGLAMLCRSIWQRAWCATLVGPFAVVFNQYGNLAGEWFAGGVEAKCIAYGFVFIGMSYAVRQSWNRAWIFFGLATALHVLVGMWTVVVIVCVGLMQGLSRWISGKPPGLPPVEFRGLAFFGLFALVGIIPALGQNWSASPQQIAQANETQVFWRLAHHQLFFDFVPRRWICFFVLFFGWAATSVYSQTTNVRLRWVNRVCGASLMLTVCAIGLGLLATTFDELGQPQPAPGIVARYATQLLTLYWFRVPDVLVPIGLALGLLEIHQHSRFSIEFFRSYRRQIPIFLICLFVAVNSLANIIDSRSGSEKQSNPWGKSRPTGDDIRAFLQSEDEWKKVCRWASIHTSHDAIFFSPDHQQTFKWYAERTEIANQKDMPQDAVAINEWCERRARLYGGLDTSEFGLLAHFNHELIELAERYDVDYLIVEQRSIRARAGISYPVTFEMVYPPEHLANDSWFVVFKTR